MSAIYRIGKEPLFRTLLLTLAFIVLSGTLFYYQIEGWALFDAFYFAFFFLAVVHNQFARPCISGKAAVRDDALPRNLLLIGDKPMHTFLKEL